MKLKKCAFRLAALLLYAVILSVNSVYAQKVSGEISGVVKDQSTQEVLPYAVVSVKGTAIYAVTDPDGLYRFTNLEPGEYTLQTTFIGYSVQEVPVILKSGEKKNVDITMSEAFVGIGEVTITAQRMGQNAAINQRLNSDALVNVVSKDAIRELPDVNAAEAIGRLPGISLTRSGGEGAKVILRGLDPKFTNVSINGIKQPGTDLESGADRSVDLSNISPEMLSGIEVFKSPTADMDGDAIAGVVNLVISKAMDIPKNQFRVYGGYNGLSEDFGDFKASWDFSRRFFAKKLGVMAQANYDKKDRMAQGITNTYYIPDNQEPEKFYISEVTLMDRKQKTERCGASAFFDYQFDNVGLYINNIFNSSPRKIYTQDEKFERNNQRITHDLNLKEDKTYSLNSSLGGNWRLPAMKIDWNLTRVQTHVYNPYEMKMQFQANALLDPNTDFSQVLDPKTYIDNTVFKGGTDNLSAFRNTSFEPDTLKQVNYIAKVDIEIPYSFGDKIAGILKFGGKYQTENRKRSGQTFRDWPLDLYPEQKLLVLANDPRDLAVDAGNSPLLSNFHNQKGTDLMNGDYHMYAHVPESQVRFWKDHHYGVGDLYKAEYANNLEGNENRYYKSMERTAAGYVMLKLNYGDLITFVPGLRYEYSDNDYTGIYSTLSNFPAITGFYRIQKSNQGYGEFLPSIHLKVKPTQWMDFRISTVKTLSRPNYMWLLPRLRYVANSFQVSKSNPDLKHATAWNYDASVTIYTSKFGLLSFGGYIKRINNMFYQVSGTLTAQQSADLGLPAQSFGLAQDFINLDDSYVKGLEFEYNTHFNFLPSPYNRFLLGFNITRLWSSTDYLLWVPVTGLETIRDRPTLGVDFERSYYDKMKDRMPSQVDVTLNAWLGFEWKGFSTRASLGYQGTRLTGINTQQRSDAFNTYTASTLRLDFTAKQRINNMFSVLLNLNNLTNETDRGYRYQSKYPTYKNMYGFTGEIGIQINL